MNTNHSGPNNEIHDEPANFEFIERFLASCPSPSFSDDKKNECGGERRDRNDHRGTKVNRGFADESSGRNGSEKKNATTTDYYAPPDRTAEELWADKGIKKGKNYNSLKAIPVNITGRNVRPWRINSFVDAGFGNLLLENLMKSGYDEPTPVQQYSIPIVIGERDLMASTQTGSGKTGAYLLPVIHVLLRDQSGLIDDDPRISHPQAIVLSPTRELALQIFELAKKFTQGSYLKVRTLYGGTSRNLLNQRLKDGCNILIATPGRLLDSLRRRWLDFSQVRFLIIDEADRMLDMGFRVDIQEICSHKTMPDTDSRQTLMFSATLPRSVQILAQKYMKEYIFLAVGQVGSANKDVQQRFLSVEKDRKRFTLIRVLNERGDNRGTLVFVERKRDADFVARYLLRHQFAATSIHSDRDQSDRERALRNFKNQVVHVLVATSVASRGLDIKDVKHVINYDLPPDVDEYVQRIGRTGRLGNQGFATSFYCQERDGGLAKDIVRILKQAQQKVPAFLENDDCVNEWDKLGEVRKFGGYDYREKNEDW